MLGRFGAPVAVLQIAALAAGAIGAAGASRAAISRSIDQGLSPAQVWAAADRAQLPWLVGTGAVVIVAPLAALLILSRRTWSMASVAAHLAGGEAQRRVPEPSPAELGALAHAVNLLAERLRTQIGQLRAQQHERDSVLRSMDDALLALDNEQRVLMVNRAAQAMLGLGERDVRGRLLQEITRQPALNAFVEQAARADGAHTADFELEGDLAANVHGAATPLRDESGRATGVLVLLSDVTQLRRLEVVRSDFAANVSHELRTPITNIKGYAETLATCGLDDHEQAMGFVRTIERNADRMKSIVDDLLMLTALEGPGAREALGAIPSPVVDVVEWVKTNLAREAEAKRIRVETSVSPGLRAVMNAHLVEQALGNLVANAIKYSPEATLVRIEARRGEGDDRDMVHIAVVDQGPGIAPEHQPRVFERFYRVDKARSRAAGGTGLGLAIVKHIALIHDGRVTVESTVGRGSRFELSLPSAEGWDPAGGIAVNGLRGYTYDGSTGQLSSGDPPSGAVGGGGAGGLSSGDMAKS